MTNLAKSSTESTFQKQIFDFSILCNWQQLSSLLKAIVKVKKLNLSLIVASWTFLKLFMKVHDTPQIPSIFFEIIVNIVWWENCLNLGLKRLFKSISSIDFSILCNWQHLSSLLNLKPLIEVKKLKFDQKSSAAQLQKNVCLVVYNAKSRHQNCINWRKTCHKLKVWQPHGQMVLYISWTHNFGKKVWLMHKFLW